MSSYTHTAADEAYAVYRQEVQVANIACCEAYRTAEELQSQAILDACEKHRDACYKAGSFPKH